MSYTKNHQIDSVNYSSIENISSSSISILRQMGYFKDYLLLLDSIKQQIISQETELNIATKDFFKVTEYNEDKFRNYFGILNNYLLQSIKLTNYKNVPINSDDKLLDLINTTINSTSKLTNSNDKSQKDWLLMIENLTDFHENLKYTKEMLQITLDNFERHVLNQLKQLSVLEYMVIDKDLIQSQDYQMNISNYLTEIMITVKNFRLLTISSRVKLQTDLFSNSSLSSRICIHNKTDDLPILLIIPDLISKLQTLFRFSKMWLDTEEKYLYQIRQDIRELKIKTKEKCNEIADVQQAHNRLLKDMRASYLACQNNKKRMKDVTTQLDDLHKQIVDSREEYEKKISQKTHNQNLMEFLEISINRTKRNYGLQLKRQKLKREITDLETNIALINNQISDLSTKINFTTATAETVAQKSRQKENEYGQIKQEFTVTSHSVQEVRKDLQSLKRSLNTLQSIETLKTSPEFLEIWSSGSGIQQGDQQQQQVKLAPSLLSRINQKKKAKNKKQQSVLKT